MDILDGFRMIDGGQPCAIGSIGDVALERAATFTFNGGTQMKSATERFTVEEGNVIADLLRAALLLIWSIVRIPILVVLAFLEPFVRLILSGIAVLSVLAGLVYKGSSVTPPIPFWVTVCVSVGCLLLVPIYHGLLRLLSR